MASQFNGYSSLVAVRHEMGANDYSPLRKETARIAAIVMTRFGRGSLIELVGVDDLDYAAIAQRVEVTVHRLGLLEPTPDDIGAN